MFSFSLSLLYTLFMCPTVSNLYNNNYNNNCLFDTTIRYSTYNCFLHTQLHTRLTEFLLIVDCFYGPTRPVKRTFLKQKFCALAFSRTLLRVCTSILVYPSFLLLLVYLERVRWICILVIDCFYVLSVIYFEFINL